MLSMRYAIACPSVCLSHDVYHTKTVEGRMMKFHSMVAPSL